MHKKNRSISQIEEAVELVQVWCIEQVLPTPVLNTRKTPILFNNRDYLFQYFVFPAYNLSNFWFEWNNWTRVQTKNSRRINIESDIYRRGKKLLTSPWWIFYVIHQTFPTNQKEIFGVFLSVWSAFSNEWSTCEFFIFG
jgi:hypothetical protein